jgi:hypothetical protein
MVQACNVGGHARLQVALPRWLLWAVDPWLIVRLVAAVVSAGVGQVPDALLWAAGQPQAHWVTTELTQEHSQHQQMQRMQSSHVR